MRTALVLLLCYTAAARSAAAQTDYYARVGLTGATRLLKDNILQEITVRQSLAPTLALGVAVPFTPLYRIGLEGSITSSGYHSTEGSAETDLGTLRTGSLILGLDGPVWRQFRWRAGVGLLRYWPADDTGIFLQGGSTRFLVGAGLDYRRPALSHWDLMVALRYDFHRFTTDELVTRGFTGSQGVQRVSLSLGLGRAHP
jgi:hypothetical protein